MAADLTCTETNYGYGDIAGDQCDWYDNYPSGCGLYDTDDFSSNDMCCACGGGAGTYECANTEGDGRDWGGDDCSWYVDYQSWCGYYDDADFTASEMCCACQDVQSVVAWNLSYTEDCSDTDEWLGVADSWGDGCEWYDNNPGYCGVFDTADFQSDKHCCSCAGGINWDGFCSDSNDGWTDSYGDGCDWYVGWEYTCGDYDTDYFKANEHCCSCGAGAQGYCTWDSKDFGDIGGDGCDWYEGENKSWCGVWDDEDFEAAYCCQCNTDNDYWYQMQLKAEISARNQNIMAIFTFIVVVLIAAVIAYQHGKKTQAQEIKVQKATYVKNNVTEKLI